MEIFPALVSALVPISLLGFAFLSQWLFRVAPKAIGTATLVTFGFAWVCTIVALGRVIVSGMSSVALITLPDTLGSTPVFGFLADRVNLVLLLLVITVSGIVHLFSIRAMREERTFRRYFGLLTVVTLEVSLVVLANSLLMLCVFWILKGLTLTFLIAHYRERPQSWRAALTKLRFDLAGDAAFLAALVLAWNTFGTVEIAAINQRVLQSPQTLPALPITAITLLMLCAAMAKSAQFPFHRWLPQSVEAPTPVSALMHAGLINSGGFLIIRFNPLFIATPVTLLLALIVGGITAIYGTLVMLTRTDVKGMLVYSTMGQMGFMIIECGLGAFGLAMLHIVAHGLYKATAFLGAGSAVSQQRLATPLGIPTHTQRPFPTVGLWLTGGVTAALLLILPTVMGYGVSTATILLAFAWVTIFGATSPLLYAHHANTIIILAAVIILTPLYLLGIHAIELFFAPVVGIPQPAHPAVVLIAWLAIALIGLFPLVQRSNRVPAWAILPVRRLYVRALFAGYSR